VAKDLPERRAAHELEHQVVRAVGHLAEVAGRGDVLVLDVGADDRLALEARDEPGQALGVGVQDLDRHALAHVDVLARVDDPHPAGREHVVDAVAVGDDRADERVGTLDGGRIRHHRGVFFAFAPTVDRHLEAMSPARRSTSTS